MADYAVRELKGAAKKFTASLTPSFQPAMAYAQAVRFA